MAGSLKLTSIVAGQIVSIVNIPAGNRHSFPLVVRGNRSLLIAVNKGYTGNWLINQLNDVYLGLIVGDICVFLSNNRRGREVDVWSTGGSSLLF